MIDENTTDIPPGLEQGLGTDITRFRQLGADLLAGMREAWDYGEERGASAHWKAGWLRHWDHVEEVLREIRELLALMNHGAILACDTRRLESMLAKWKKLQSDDRALLDELTAVCGHSSERGTERALQRAGSRVSPPRPGSPVDVVSSAAGASSRTWKTGFILMIVVVMVRATFALVHSPPWSSLVGAVRTSVE